MIRAPGRIGSGLRWALGTLLAALATAHAQEPPFMSAGWFAPTAFPLPSPLSDSDRVPLVDLPPREIGSRSLVPARRSRLGFEPRIGVTAEYSDNVLFTPTDRAGDLVTVASLGLNYRADTRRSYLEADYSVESTWYADQSELSKALEAQNGFVFVSFSPTDTTRVGVVDNFQQLEDPLGQLVPGVLPDRGTTTQNYFDGQASWRVVPKLDLRAGVGSVVQRFEDPAAIDNSQTDLEAGALLLTSARNRAGVKYRYRTIDFRGAPDASTDTVAFEDEFSVSPLMTLRALAGVAAIQGAAAEWRPVLGAALVGTTRQALWGLSFDQDVRATGGLGSPFFGRTVAASAGWRLAPRWYLAAGASFSTFESLGSDELEIDVLEPRTTLSYTVRPGLVVAARYVYVRQEPKGGAGTQASRIGITLALSF